MITVIDETDRVMAEKRLPNDLTKILAFLAPWQAEFAGVVVESTYYGRPGIVHGLSVIPGCDRPISLERSANYWPWRTLMPSSSYRRGDLIASVCLRVGKKDEGVRQKSKYVPRQPDSPSTAAR
ncbi:hypothetical protein AYM40_07100 [Paraburkholderia phytofirmans OLGA172]|uniref:Uncharacterized protein n=1 Tax=Paraburkholderia phytofirmans OLGA172 TaxID=1417228 RepID=A0A167VW48_9BURK|nr:hypothetical protein [Paraburkholderia phytofirmans]ANB72157.1 hypothetical protein AYM40_07100 [Paraburkholderia phytofirmans OLGA172]